MNRYFKNITLALGLVFTASVIAQETAPAPGTSNEQQVEVGQPGSWNLSVGLGYRKFKDPKFKGGSAMSGTYTGFYTDSPANMKNSAEAALAGSGRFTTLHEVRYNGGSSSGSNKGSYGFGESIGLTIGFSVPFYQQDHIALSLVGNFSYYQLDSQSRHSGGGAGGNEMTYVYNVVNQNPSPYYYDSYASSNFSSASWNKWRMDLYVFDLGVSASYEFENSLALFAALGPSMTIADMESNSTVSSPNGAKRSTENEFETEFGYYISGGASYWFNERYGVSMEVRYDKAFGSIGTRYVTQDLDTWGGQLKFLCRF